VITLGNLRARLMTASCEVNKRMKERKKRSRREKGGGFIYTWDEGGSLALHQSDSLSE
jgi:hypothetical protein